MAKVRNISGFPEWLPEQKIVEEALIGRVRAVYESFGFAPIETPAVELYSTLAAKGGEEKEIYALRRAAAGPDEAGEKDDALALHFDLTVPLARYVAQHLNDLVFPFKRYQLQKVWRGERPQKGRFREFYQLDIDVIARDVLPLAADAEVVTVLDHALAALALGEHGIRLNNRKILQGLYESFGLDSQARAAAIATVDKLDKIGEEGVRDVFRAADEIDDVMADRILETTTLRAAPAEALAKLRAMGVANALFDEGVDELERVIELVPSDARKRLVVDLSLARGLDYYTGTIFEAYLDGQPEFGTVASGGRYDDLASQFTNKKLPGVGASIGLTRLMDLAFQKKLVETGRKSPARALIAIFDESERAACNAVADEVREHGVACEVALKKAKLGKQMQYADAKGIEYVLFVNAETKTVEAKELASGEQKEIEDLAAWCRGVLHS
ncbi:MAG: histidine--tRNA ligase [Gemmatimonadetes bacterium]|nr:histidine--tRNA ligase [Gemmatimonadota bacterium]